MSHSDHSRSARYRRQVVIPEVRVVGQQRLLNARVMMIGMGGLGTPAATYLAAAGVGCLHIVDGDVVDESNLARQWLYSEADIGANKAECAARRLRASNPHCTVHVHPQHATTAWLAAMSTEVDIILDGTDDLEFKTVIANLVPQLNIPLVHGAIFKFHGQVAVIRPSTPAAAIAHIVAPQLAPVDRCAEAGVLNVIPGTIGILMATEVLKYLLGLGQLLDSHLLLYDGLSTEFRKIKF